MSGCPRPLTAFPTTPPHYSSSPLDPVFLFAFAQGPLLISPQSDQQSGSEKVVERTVLRRAVCICGLTPCPESCISSAVHAEDPCSLIGRTTPGDLWTYPLYEPYIPEKRRTASSNHTFASPRSRADEGTDMCPAEFDMNMATVRDNCRIERSLYKDDARDFPL